jgi:hypothetical protein
MVRSQYNNGVHGDWITGNMMMNVLLLPLVFAVLPSAARSVGPGCSPGGQKLECRNLLWPSCFV